HPLDDIHPQVGVGIAHRLNCLQRAAADEYTQACKQRLLVRVEQLVAPINRVADGLLALRQIARTAGEQLQPVAQPCQQRLWREELAAARPPPAFPPRPPPPLTKFCPPPGDFLFYCARRS